MPIPLKDSVVWLKQTVLQGTPNIQYCQMALPGFWRSGRKKKKENDCWDKYCPYFSEGGYYNLLPDATC